MQIFLAKLQQGVALKWKHPLRPKLPMQWKEILSGRWIESLFGCNAAIACETFSFGCKLFSLTVFLYLLVFLPFNFCWVISLLSVTLFSFIIVVSIISWPGKLFRLSVLLYLLVFLPFIVVFIFVCVTVVFYHRCLLSSLSLLYDGQASYSGCLVMPDRAVEAAQSRPLSDIRILLSDDRRW